VQLASVQLVKPPCRSLKTFCKTAKVIFPLLNKRRQPALLLRRQLRSHRRRSQGAVECSVCKVASHRITKQDKLTFAAYTEQLSIGVKTWKLLRA
jgi:hypothetical protein